MTRLIGLAILLLPLLEIAGFILVSRWIGLPGVLLAVNTRAGERLSSSFVRVRVTFARMAPAADTLRDARSSATRCTPCGTA